MGLGSTAAKPQRVRVRVPATTANLGPGFDCLGLALRLYNEIEADTTGQVPLKITVGGSATADHLPLDERNLVYRAAARIFELAGDKPANLTLDLTLAAPLARGLGSSSSAIVGGMTIANELLGRPLPADALLMEMVEMEGHPDNVVPCAVGGLTASVMLPDRRISYLREHPAANIRFVVLIPDYELATAKARQAIPKTIPLKDAVFNLTRVPFVFDRLRSGNLKNLNQLMDDRLHQPYRKPLIREYDLLASQAEAAGAAGVCISGAGPTVLAIVDEPRAERVAQVWRDVMAGANIKGEAKVLEADADGAVVAPVV